MKRKARIRGVSLMEMLVSAAIASAVFGTACTLYVQGTRGFYQEQSQSYVQFRTRSALERMATETRGAKSFMASTTIGGSTYTASDGSSSPACLIILVPSQDANGLFYYGTSSSEPNTLVTDIIVYYSNPNDKTLRRTVRPSANVTTSDGTVRSSFRPAEQDVVVAHDVGTLRFVFKDRDGLPIGSAAKTKIASVDLKAEVRQPSGAGGGLGQQMVAISGVRLRNMRSGSIPGVVTQAGTPLQGAKVEARFASSVGAYQTGTIVGSAQTDATGNFEIYGLEQGNYDVIVTPSSGNATTITGVNVPEEQSATPVDVAVP